MDVPGREGMPLRSGFRVMALEGGVVIVQYRDGCRYKVEDDDLHVVGDVSPCEAGYIPYVTTRPLSQLTDTPPPGY